MSITEAKKNLESVVAKAKLAVASAAEQYVAALVRHSIGSAEAAEPTSRPGPRKATKRKPKGEPRKVARVAAPKPNGKRKRTSAAQIDRHKGAVLSACTKASKYASVFNRAGVQAKISDRTIDVGRMLSLLVQSGEITKSGDRRNTVYKLAAKSNGAAEHVVVRDAEPIGEEG